MMAKHLDPSLLRSVTRALSDGILPAGAHIELDVELDDSLVILVFYVDPESVAVTTRERTLTARCRISGEALAQAAHATYDGAAVIGLIRHGLREANTYLFVCHLHEDCRACPDLGRVCYAQRRSGVRAINARCE